MKKKESGLRERMDDFEFVVVRSEASQKEKKSDKGKPDKK